MPYLFTSESVSEGHPDKIADQISDALLDEFLRYDPESKVACETLVTTGLVVLSGEVRTRAYVDVQSLAREVIRRIGYTKAEYMFDADACGIISSIHEQSPDIRQGVVREKEEEQGAGDQGMMFGYACTETDEYMPLPIELAHVILQELSSIRREGNEMTYLRPDAKSQVTVEYNDDKTPNRIHTIVVSTQHDEFAENKEEIERVRKYSSIADALHTDLHECVGHASGKLAEGTDPNALRNYQSPLEEARADLFALYYIPDEKLISLNLLPSKDAAKAEYDSYIRNGLLAQLVRIKPGKQIEQAHMRARAMIARWAYENGKKDNVIEMISRNGKTYVRINDYEKLRTLFGDLLREVQRIKSEGDFEAGKALIETYGVKVDPVLHNELLARYEKLKLAPYSGFINPVLKPVFDDQGRITDVKVEYEDDYLSQMIYYGSNYSFLPVKF